LRFGGLEYSSLRGGVWPRSRVIGSYVAFTSKSEPIP